MRHDLKLHLIGGLGLLAGCSSFNLGGMAYCPHGQDCSFVVRPAAAASAVALE